MSITYSSINKNEIEQAAALELLSFPEGDAVPHDAMAAHIQKDPTRFITAHDGNKLVGMVYGLRTEAHDFSDDFFLDAENHHENAKNCMVLGVEVHPDYRHHQVAHQMMELFLKNEKEHGTERVVLTCEDHLISFYEQFGYRDLGISASVFGNKVWHEMEYTF